MKSKSMEFIASAIIALFLFLFNIESFGVMFRTLAKRAALQNKIRI